MNILSIDIGMINLALVYVNVNSDYTIKEVVFNKLVNLVDLNYHKDLEDIYKTNETSDRIRNLILHYNDFFTNADKILIERQPPMGFKCIEQVIFFMYRQKTVLISPNAMHSFFQIGHLDYDGRKDKTEKIASEFLSYSSYYNNLERKHDLADSMCMIIFYLNSFREKYLKEQKNKEVLQKIKEKNVNFDDYIFNRKGCGC